MEMRRIKRWGCKHINQIVARLVNVSSVCQQHERWCEAKWHNNQKSHGKRWGLEERWKRQQGQGEEQGNDNCHIFDTKRKCCGGTYFLRPRWNQTEPSTGSVIHGVMNVSVLLLLFFSITLWHRRGLKLLATMVCEKKKLVFVTVLPSTDKKT